MIIMLADIYARESSDDKEKSPPIEMQIERCKEFIRQKGWEVGTVYADDGWSGGSWNRPAWNRLINETKANRTAKILVTWNQDRLARDVEQFFMFYRIMTEKNKEIWSVTEGKIDMHTLGGRLKHGMLAFAAETFRLVISDKVRKVYESKKAKGERWGRMPKLTEEEREYVRMLKREHPKLGYHRLAKLFEQQRGKKVSYQTIRRVLNSEKLETPAT